SPSSTSWSSGAGARRIGHERDRPSSAAEAHEQDKNGYDWRGALEDLRGAYADTTIHDCARDFALFVTWCNEQGSCPLPASPQTVARYLEANSATLRATTLVRRLAAIVRVHRLLELENPADSERVRLARRRIQRHRTNRPRQALGVDRSLRDQLLSACPETLAGKRDKVLVALGFEGLCRLPNWLPSGARMRSRTATVNWLCSSAAARPTGLARAAWSRCPKP